jgi:hypothetical protein
MYAMTKPRWGLRPPGRSSLAIAAAAAVAAFPATSAAASARLASQTEAGAASATCTKAAISKAVTAAGKAQKAPARLLKKQFKCADGWAYADANLGRGAEAVTVTFVFKASGATWALKNRAKVCKAPGNQVPAAIYKLACTTN